MTKQTINVGSTELAGDGESIRSAFVKVNSNFTELYTLTPLAASATYAMSFNTATIVGLAVTATYAQTYDPTPILSYLAANTSTSVVGNATKIVNGTWTLTLSTAGSILLNGTVFQGGGGGLTDRLTAGNKSVILDTDGNLTIPTDGLILGLSIIGGEGTNIQADQTTGEVYISTFGGGSSSTVWTFSTSGQLTSPGHIVPSANLTYDLGSTSSQWRSIYVGTGTIYIGGIALGVNRDNYVTVDGNPVITVNTASGSLTVQGDTNIVLGTVAISATAPSAATTGSQWFNTTEARTYIAYNNQWVDSSPTLIPAPNTYLDDIEIEDSTILINGSTLTINTSGTLLVNGTQVTGSGGESDRLTSSTSSLIYNENGQLFTTSSLYVSSVGTSTYSAFGWADGFVNATKAAGVIANSPFNTSTGDLFVYSGYVNGPFTNQVWTFGADGVLTLSTSSTILGNSEDPNVYIETSTTATTSTWTFGTNGVLTLPAATPVIKGGGTGTDVIIVASDGTTTSSWTVNVYGDLTHNTNFIGSPSSVTISSSRDISLESTIAGIPIGIADWNGGGGWNQGSYINTATTGGSGTGLTVNVAAGGGGYININAITINNPGSGYTDGDVITINNENNIPGTFTISTVTNVSKVWTFSNTGTVRFPDNTVQSTAYPTGQQTVYINAASTVTSIELTVLTGTVIEITPEVGYAVPGETHSVYLPFQINEINPNIPLGTRVTVMNKYNGTVNVGGWPDIGFALGSYASVDMVYHYNRDYGGNLWWVTGSFSW